jgi:uncharacterized protein YjeT (DUF2065 family)
VPETNSSYLLLLATSSGLAYVMRERKMAFPPTRRIRLGVGDRLLLYTTRGIFSNPIRDRGRVVGTAEVASQILPLETHRLIAGRTYTSECELRLTGLATLGQGVVLSNIVRELAVFQPNPAAWSAHMRRSVLRLPSGDYDYIMRELKPVLQNPDKAVGAYIERADSSSRAR